MATIRRTIAIIAAALSVALMGAVAATHASAATPTGSISGTVRESGTGVPVAGIRIELFKEITRTLSPPFGNGKPFKTPGFVTAVESGAGGRYTLSGLPASDAAGYWVCFNTVGFGYEPVCYLDEIGYAPFPDPLGLVQLPPNAGRVRVNAGQHVTRIDANVRDIAFNPAITGAVAGKVTQTVLGLPLRQVRVTLVNPGGHVVLEALTRADGTYRLVFLPPGSGYRVCFDGSSAKGGLSVRGYTSRCRFAPVSVAAGAVTSNVNAQLSGMV